MIGISACFDAGQTKKDNKNFSEDLKLKRYFRQKSRSSQTVFGGRIQ